MGPRNVISAASAVLLSLFVTSPELLAQEAPGANLRVDPISGKIISPVSPSTFQNANLGTMPGANITGSIAAAALPLSTALANGLQPLPTVMTLPPTVTVQTTVPGALTKTVTPTTAALNFNYYGGPATANSGGVWFPASNGAQGGATVEWMTDAPIFSFTMSRQIVPVQISVDGQRVSPSPTALTTATGGSIQVVDFTNAGGRARRKISIEFALSTIFFAVNVDALSSVWKPDEPEVRRIAWVGDSYTMGTGGEIPCASYANIASKLLGFKDCWLLGQGGTGYTVTTGATFANRIADLAAANPQAVGVFGGINDSSLTSGQVQAYLTLIRAQGGNLATCPIFVGGPFMPYSPPSAGLIANEAAISAGVTAMADPKIFFIPDYGDPAGQWITGAGTVGAPTGVGNSDIYITAAGTHPNDAGHEYLGRIIARRIAAIIRANGF